MMNPCISMEKIIFKFSGCGAVILSPVDLSFVLSALSRYIWSSVFGSGESSFLFLYSFSPNSSAFKVCFWVGMDGREVGGKLALILS